MVNYKTLPATLPEQVPWTVDQGTGLLGLFLYPIRISVRKWAQILAGWVLQLVIGLLFLV